MRRSFKSRILKPALCAALAASILCFTACNEKTVAGEAVFVEKTVGAPDKYPAFGRNFYCAFSVAAQKRQAKLAVADRKLKLCFRAKNYRPRKKRMGANWGRYDTFN